jgi:hypothetical protein
MSGQKAVLMPTHLTPGQRRMLKIRISKDLTYEQITGLEEVLLETATVQQLNWIATENLTKADSVEQTKVLLSQLKSIIITLKNLPSLSENLLNTYHSLAKDGKKEYGTEIQVAEFLASAVDIRKAVKLMHENPLPTNDRKNKYTDSLESIANRFLELFPENKVSYAKDSIFYKLIKYWHQYVLCSGLKDPKAQIKTLIEIRKGDTTT